MALPKIAIRGRIARRSLFRAAWVRVFRSAPLAGAVAKRGGVGTVSFVALDRFVERRTGRNVSHREAAQFEIREARRLAGNGGAIAINCMALVERTYALSVQGAIDGGVDAVIVGAGLPMTLPEIVGTRRLRSFPLFLPGGRWNLFAADGAVTDGCRTQWFSKDRSRADISVLRLKRLQGQNFNWKRSSVQ